MKTFDYQFIVVGAGAAGFAAVIKAEQLSIKTLVVSGGKVPLGGTCINVGCMPSKRLLTIAEAYWNAGHQKFPGIETKATNLDFKQLIESKDSLINTLQHKSYAEVLSGLKHVTLKEGDVKFVDDHVIEINGEKVSGEKFLISTGSSTFIPPIPGLENVPYLTNIEALSLKEKPESLIILGGGPLGLEFSQIFNRLGTKVTVLQAASQVANREEPELANLLQKKLEEEGVTIHTSAQTKSVSQHNSLVEVQFEADGKETLIKAEKILVATGVRANTQSLNLESTKVRVGEKGGIITDEMMQTNIEHIYAAGDVVDQSQDEISPKLETVAGREGFVAASNALENKNIKIDFNSVPHAIFTDPTLASVGLTDAQVVQQQGLVCSCRTISLELVPKAHILGATDGLIKMVINAKTEEVLGIHMVGIRADEIISMASFIVKNRLTLEDIIETTFIFPTISEAVKWVAQSFKKDVSKLSCCTE